ncbi:MAG: ADOP family duplicated permease [Acidobacteriota bacterium]
MLKAAASRRAFEREMALEMRDHIERHTEALVREGLSPAEARRRARMEFGSVESFKESCRQERRLDLLDELARNLRHGARLFARAPALTATVVGVLGLGVGVNIAMWSVVDAVLLRPLPFPEPGRLALVETAVGEGEEVRSRLSTHNGFTWQTLAGGVEGVELAAYSEWPSGANVVHDGAAEHLRQQRVGAGFFRVLGVEPLLGREFDPADDVPGGPLQAVIGYGLWQRLFAGRADVLGASVLLRGEPCEIIGVMPRGFRTWTKADLWTPLRPSTSGEGEGANYSILGRLEPGVSWRQAKGQMRLAGAPAAAALEAGPETELWLTVEPLQAGMHREMRSRLLLSWVTLWIVLVVASFNVTGLLLAHARLRRREIGIRFALGGGRGAIVRQLLAESLLLSALGGGLGLGVAAALIAVLRERVAASLGLWQPIALDARVLAAALALTLITVALCGLYPAVAGGRGSWLRGRRIAAGHGSLARRALVVGQLAAVVALLVGAGLMARSLTHLQRLEPGFEPSGLVAASVSLQDARFAGAEKTRLLLEEVADRLRAEPEIAAAAAGLSLPYERPLNVGVTVAGDSESRITNLSYVTSGFFETLGTPLLTGRTLSDLDRADSPPVAVVNRSFVRTYLGGGPALGQRIEIAGGEREIVGVVADTQQRPGWGTDEPIGLRSAVFVPVSQTSPEFLELIHGWFQPSWVVRPAVSGVAAGERLRLAVAQVAPSLPVARVRSLETLRREVLSEERFQALLTTAAAAVALLLAAVGVGGLIASSVAERQRELAIRLALGATSRQTLGQALLPGLQLAALGLALGGALSLATARVLAAFLHGVDAVDPATYAAVAVVLPAAVVLASALPAARILRLDPASALRAE